MDALWLLVALSILIFIVMAILVGRIVAAVLRRRAERQPREREQPEPQREWEQVTLPAATQEAPDPKTCPACDGTGFCTRCNGHGRYPARGSNTLIDCANCGSSGACEVCAGTGRVNGTATPPSA